MKSILTALTAIAVYSRCYDFGYTVKGVLVGVITGALAGAIYEALKKAPPDEHRECGRCLPNGIKNIPRLYYITESKGSQERRRNICKRST